MKSAESLSRVLILAGILIVIGVPLVFWRRTPLVHAQMADNGGWTPGILQAEAGQPLHLRLTSDDVVHGFAVGQMNMEAVDIEPGKVTDVSLTFDKPGVYTFYCTRWCGANHWRMRGTIEVRGSESEPEPVSVPLYIQLGLDIDAPHDAPVVPLIEASALRGRKLASGLDLSVFSSPEYYREHSPYQLFEKLDVTDLEDQEKWDVASYIWQSHTTSDSLDNGRKLFARNCAACHGEYGAGDGVFADDLAAAGQASMQDMSGAENIMIQTPVDFTDPKRILGASPALLQGKILRGGMGTGMPMWGAIFTEEQIWDLVAYLYSFQFDYQGETR